MHRTGHRVRIAVRLVDTETGQRLWGAIYDRELSPDAIFGVQAEIARHIATALRTRLARVERLRIARPPTGDLAAYDFYLKGREHLDRGDLQSAEALFRNALERDPQLAVARVYLARAYGRRGGSPERAHQWADSVYTHVSRALALDSKLPDAWVEYSNYLGARGHVRARLEALERAVRLDPNHAGAVMRISAVHADRGRLDESVHWLRKTVALEPTEAPHYARMGVRYADLGDFQEAERWLARALELAPSSPWAHGGLAILHLLRGDLPRATREVRTLSRPGPEPDHFWARFAGDAELRLGHYDRAAEHYQRILSTRAELRIEPRFARPPTAELGFILLRSGDTTRAEQLLGEAEEWAVRRVDSGGRTAEPFWTRVMVAAVRGETDAAIGHLERAVERGWDVSWRWYYDDAINPLFEGLAGLPRYERLLVELAARVDSQRQRLPDSPEPSNRLN